MDTVNVAEWKNRLSHYLRRVRRGEELVIRDRDEPVARLVPLAESLDDDDKTLLAAGHLRLPRAPLPESFWRMPAPAVSARRAARRERRARRDLKSFRPSPPPLARTGRSRRTSSRSSPITGPTSTRQPAAARSAPTCRRTWT